MEGFSCLLKTKDFQLEILEIWKLVCCYVDIVILLDNFSDKRKFFTCHNIVCRHDTFNLPIQKILQPLHDKPISKEEGAVNSSLRNFKYSLLRNQGRFMVRCAFNPASK